MKYKDYYGILGVARDAGQDDIKKAYRKLARKYHPDVSKELNAEEKFKEMGEAYETLKDPEKRTAYDQLGTHGAGQEFRPPPEFWQRYAQQQGGSPQGGFQQGSFEDIDLSDLFAAFGGGARRGSGKGSANMHVSGRDYEAAVRLAFDQAFHGTEVELDLSMPEPDANGVLRRVPHRPKVRIPAGVADGQVLRVPGKGGKGINGGRDGDLYLDIRVEPHPLFRTTGDDVYVDLPLAPWEAVLGTSVELPTPAGSVMLKVPPGTRAGQQLRLSGRGVPRRNAKPGNLYAIAQIVVPTHPGEAERELYKQLSEVSTLDPRAHFKLEAAREH